MGDNMKLDQLTIEKRALNYLERELLSCPRLNPVLNADDKIISWDGEIQLFRNNRKNKECWAGRCPVQVKGHTVNKDELKKKTITHSVSIDDLRVYQQDGGVLYFVVYLPDDENKLDSCKIFYNEFLPFNIGEILAGIKEGQKNKNIEFIPFPKEVKEKESVIAQFIRDRGLQTAYSYNNPINLNTLLSKERTYVFWTSSDFSFIGKNKPTYLYEKSKEKDGVYFPVGRIYVKSVIAHNVPIKVRLNDKIYFDNAHIELKGKDVIKSIEFNHGLSFRSNKDGTTGKIRLTQKCTFEEYLYNLEFLQGLAQGGRLSIEGVGEGESFDFDFPIDFIKEEMLYMKKVQQLLARLHVKKHILVKDLSKKNLEDLQFLYRAIVKDTHFLSNGTTDSAFGIFNVGKLKFLLVRYLDANHKIVYRDGFDTEDIRCELVDDKGNKFPSSIYVKMKKDSFLKYDNIYYPAIIKSITKIEYSAFYGNLVNSLVLEMLAAYDEVADDEVLETAIELSNWLYSHENLPVYYINKMQSIKRKRLFTKEEEDQIRDLRGQETEASLLAGFSAILGNVDDYKYYLGKLNKEDRDKILMFPINNLIKAL